MNEEGGAVENDSMRGNVEIGFICGAFICSVSKIERGI